MSNSLRETCDEITIRFYQRSGGTILAVTGFSIVFLINWKIAVGIYILTWGRNLLEQARNTKK